MASCTLTTALLMVVATAHLAAAATNIVCYYGSWATYRAWPAKYDVTDIDTTKCTHLVYAFAGLDAATGSVASLDPYNDLEENYGKGSYKKFAALAQSNPNVKTLLAVGGWNDDPVKYSTMASTSIGRKRFATSAVNFVQQFGFQGLDLDWEYPTQRNGKPEDKANFVLLLQELSTQLKAKDLLLTVAVAASMEIIEQGYDIAGIAKVVDIINLMSFDYRTSSSSNVTGHAAPLEPRPNAIRPLSVQESVKKWVDSGAPSEKLVVGIPFFGRTYTLTSESQHGIGASAMGPGVAGDWTQEAGYLGYYEICLKIEEGGWTVAKDQEEVYAYKGNQWVSYDNADTILRKTKFVVDNKLGGVMLWPLETDDFTPICNNIKNVLLEAVNKGLGRS